MRPFSDMERMNLLFTLQRGAFQNSKSPAPLPLSFFCKFSI